MTTSEDKYFLPKYYAGKKIDQNNQMKKNLQLDEEEEGFNESCSENENEKSSMDRMEHLDNQSQSPLLLLCQQSHIGDIYCQRIQLLSKQSPIFSPIQIK